MIKKLLVLSVVVLFFNCNSEVKKAESKNIKEVKEPEVTLAYKTNAELGEGAIWNYKTQELYWIDIEGKSLNIYNPETNKNSSLETPTRIGTVVPKNEDTVLIALEDGVYNMNLKTGKTSLFVDMTVPLKGRRFNDGKCDPAGRFWVGSMHMQQKTGEASLYTFDAYGNTEIKKDSVTISNGIVWTADKKTMYYIDTPTAQIKAFDYDNSTGAISNERIAVTVSENLGFPDGMTIDSEDMVWVGMWNGNAVIRFNPKTGEILQKIEVPAHNVTSCAFGGENLDTLYITSATVDMTDEEKKEFPLAGSVFKVKPGVTGVKASFFK